MHCIKVVGGVNVCMALTNLLYIMGCVLAERERERERERLRER